MGESDISEYWVLETPAFLGKGRYLTSLKAGWRDMASSKQGRRRNLASLKKKGKGALICLCGGWRKFWHFTAMVEKGFSTVVNSVKLSWGGLQEGSAVQLHLLNMGFVLHEQSGAKFLTVSNNIYVILFMVDYCIKFIALTNFLHL